jgi:hypothetical protein
MTILGYHIERRFWIFLGILVFLIIGWIAFNRFSEKPDPLNTPAFAISELPAAAQSDDWIDPFIELNGIRAATSVSDFNQVSVNRGQPFRAQVLIPSADEAADQRPDLLKRFKGWNLVPAIYLDPTETVNQEIIDERAANLSAEELIVVAFPEGQSIGSSQGIYEVTGLLYGHSQMLGAEALAPLVLASSVRNLTVDEFTNPTTDLADLDISFRRGNVQTNVRSIEWSSGKQVRVCLEFENVGSAPINPNDYMSAATATYRLANGSQADSLSEGFNPESPLNLTDIQPESKSAGFALFPAPFEDPEETLTLRLPPGPGRQPTIITVTQSQFQTAAEAAARSGGQAVGGCA